MSLCPIAAELAALPDAEFWDTVARSLGMNTGPMDIDVDDLDHVSAQHQPCAACGEVGACAYDDQGRALIHATEDGDT